MNRNIVTNIYEVHYVTYRETFYKNWSMCNININYT